MRKLTLVGLAVAIIMTSLVGCNATKGAGKDIENTGKHIENIGNK